MFEVMCVQWSVSAGRDDELSHGEVWRVIGAADEEFHGDVFCAFHVNRIGINVLWLSDNHG